MSEVKVYPVSKEVAARTLLDKRTYQRMYQESINDPDVFWGEQCKRIDWIKPYTKVKNASFDLDNVDIRWYEDGTLNACYNCIDRHLETKGEQAAIIWEGDDPSTSATVTYNQLHEKVCKLANALKARGVGKGDVVTIYMPMIPEAAVAMLACARIGAPHWSYSVGSLQKPLPVELRRAVAQQSLRQTRIFVVGVFSRLRQM